ncbi:MAG: NmrA/HSCARG family protein [Thermoplasmata archaeon]
MNEPEKSRVRPAPKSSTVLVTGITGKQGGHVAQHLLARGHRVRGMVRDPTSSKLGTLRSQGVEILKGSFGDPLAMEKAARGVDAMFLMSTSFEGGPEAETRQANAAIDAAKAAGVPWLVYSSVGDADRKTGIPHFDSKYAVEEYLEGSGVPHAVSAPTSFMENYLIPFQIASIQQGKLGLALSPDHLLQQVALDDLGAFVVHLLENPTRFRGKRINVASDALTGRDAARILSDVLGKKVEFQQVPIAALRSQSADYAKMFEWLERAGYTADIEGLRRDYPEVGWHRFREWAARQNWTPAKT